MREVILPIHPKEYPYGGDKDCGVLTAKTILSGYDLDRYANAADYHPNAFVKTMGWTTPEMLKAILNNNGLHSEIGYAQGSDSSKVSFLKYLLQKGHPVVLMVAGVSPQKVASLPKYLRFVPIVFSKVILHWITIWGFDDERQVFYVYDSSVPLGTADTVPIGNREIKYRKAIKVWGAGILPGFLKMFGRGFLYITAQK